MVPWVGLEPTCLAAMVFETKMFQLINSYMKVPLTKHALIRICKLILGKQDNITYSDVDQVRAIIQEHLDNGQSPADIKKLYQVEYSDFGMFLKKCLGITLKPVKDAVNNYYTQQGRSNSSEKEKYKRDCQFKFDPYSCKTIPGYELLLTLGIYHPVSNPSGVVRDHMVSKEYGWRNNIPTAVISHPTNCRYITNIDNIKKGDASCITIDQLYENIKNNSHVFVTNETVFLPKTADHKKKISDANSKYMTITNGLINLRVTKDSEIPSGFRRGMTRKNNMVGQLGLEPRSEIF